MSALHKATAEIIEFKDGKNKNYRRKNGGEYLYTPEQRRARELNWILYVCEGLVGNLVHAQAVNAFTMEKTDLAAVRRTLRMAEATANEIRQHIRHTYPKAKQKRAKP